MRKSVGKTSLIVGMAQNLDKKIAYLKPFGDRLIYEKKRLWDYDSSVIKDIFNLEEKPEEMSIGFDYSKLRYVYDEEKIKQKLDEFASGDKDILFIETGRNLTYGASVHLDPISIAKYTGAKLVMVIKGNERAIDDLIFVNKYLNLEDIKFGGIIINQVKDIEEFKVKQLGLIEQTGIDVLGILPYKTELTHYSVNLIAKCLTSKVIAGEEGLGNEIEHIFIGAMGGHEAFRNPMFEKENRLIITGGDRVDIILGSLNEYTSGIILTNNIVPPSSIISRADRYQIPLLLVPSDTYKTANKVYSIEALLSKEEKGKLFLLKEIVSTHINLDKFLVF